MRRRRAICLALSIISGSHKCPISKGRSSRSVFPVATNRQQRGQIESMPRSVSWCTNAEPIESPDNATSQGETDARPLSGVGRHFGGWKWHPFCRSRVWNCKLGGRALCCGCLGSCPYPPHGTHPVGAHDTGSRKRHPPQNGCSCRNGHRPHRPRRRDHLSSAGTLGATTLEILIARICRVTM